MSQGLLPLKGAYSLIKYFLYRSIIFERHFFNLKFFLKTNVQKYMHFNVTSEQINKGSAIQNINTTGYFAMRMHRSDAHPHSRHSS